MKIWIHLNGVKEGPFEINELPLNRMDATTPVWHAGLQDWVRALDSPVVGFLFRPENDAQAPEQPAPEQQCPEQPANEQLCPEQPADEQHCPEKPEMPAPQGQEAGWQPNSNANAPEPPEGWAYPPDSNMGRQQPWGQAPQQPYGQWQQPWQPQQQQPWQPQQNYGPQQPYGQWQQPWQQQPYGQWQQPCQPPQPWQQPQPWAQQPPQQQCAFTPAGNPNRCPNVGTVWMILLSVISCGNMFAIASVVLGLIAKSRYKDGNVDGAWSMANVNDWLIILAIVTSLLQLLLLPFYLAL